MADVGELDVRQGGIFGRGRSVHLWYVRGLQTPAPLASAPCARHQAAVVGGIRWHGQPPSADERCLVHARMVMGGGCGGSKRRLIRHGESTNNVMMDRIFGFDDDADSALRNFKAVRHPDPELSPLGAQQVRSLQTLQPAPHVLRGLSRGWEWMGVCICGRVPLPRAPFICCEKHTHNPHCAATPRRDTVLPPLQLVPFAPAATAA